MSMDKWAEREVKFAKEKSNTKNDDFDYVGACCDSALKAYKSLLKDGHSGMSIGVTLGILNKLVKGQALTPIEDAPEVWAKDEYDYGDGIKRYQCNRMSSLFKYVYPDGTVKYKDVNRIIGVNINNPNLSYYSGRTNKWVDELFPITLPYTPNIKPYKVYADDFLSDPANASYTDWDVEAYYYILTPTGEKIEINKFYFSPDGKKNIEITKERYEELKRNSIENAKK